MGWEVEVRRDGDNIVTIGDRMMAGKPEFSDEDEAVIRGCADALLSFVGWSRAAPEHQEWVFVHEVGEWRCHCGYVSTAWDRFVGHFQAPPRQFDQPVIELPDKHPLRIRSEKAEAALVTALRLAKEATNGWACYAKRKIELDEIARLHGEIDALSRAGLLAASPQEAEPLAAVLARIESALTVTALERVDELVRIANDEDPLTEDETRNEQRKAIMVIIRGALEAAAARAPHEDGK